MPLYNPPLKSVQAYTPSNVTPNRTYNPTTSTSSQDKQTLGTLIQDLKTAGLLK